MQKESQNLKRNALTKAMRAFFCKNNPKNLFIILMSISLIVFLIAGAIGGVKELTSIFYLNASDLFMDMFNSIRDVFQGAGVYTERHVIYPPMANLVYLFLSLFIPAEYGNSAFDDRATWVNYPECIAVAIVFSVVLIALYSIVIYLNLPKERFTRILLAVFFVINVPFAFLIERGNIIIISIIFTAVYMFTYSSESKVLREVGLISLAFAFSIKLYPALFGFFLIVDKRYKDALRCSLYALLMLALPSFFFGGLTCLRTLAENIIAFSKTRIDMGFENSANGLFGGLGNALVLFYENFYLFMLLTFIVGCFFIKKKWKIYMYAIMVYNVIPALTQVYSWVLMAVPLIIFFKEEKLTVKNVFYFLIMTLPFMFYPSVLLFAKVDIYTNFNKALVYIVTILSCFVFLVETIIAIVKKVKETRAKKRENATIGEEQAGSIDE